MNTRVAAIDAARSSQQAASSGGWSSRLGFVLAAAGSAVGLGNVWKFPYIAGEYGGGAFVLVYLACVALIGLPILMAEIVIGRRGGRSPIYSFQKLSKIEGHSPRWQLIGWMGIACAFCILSFYSVVAGWSLAYLWHSVSGVFDRAGVPAVPAPDAMNALFGDLLSSPLVLLAGHSAVMAATVVIVANGIQRGIERAVRWMVPGLFLLLIALVAYAAATTGQFARAAAFLFRPNLSALTVEAALVALGHAFFTLSVGMTVMMAYGSYLKRDVPVGKASVAIAGLDTLIALLAGLAIFPLVFAHGLEPAAGPGLIFVTLPIAFTELPGGSVIATLFFLFLALAALSSTISILEPAVDHLADRLGWGRYRATALTGIGVWLLGFACALAFNVGADLTLFGKNLFDLLDFVTSSLLLPLGGMLTAVYAGWVLSSGSLLEEAAIRQPGLFAAWRFLLRYVAPIGVAAVLISGLV